jgi:uncharacterized protein
MADDTPTTDRKPRGFAAMPPERRSAIGRQGGIAGHKLGTAHEFTREEAQAAGRKGGQISKRPKRGAGASIRQTE